MTEDSQPNEALKQSKGSGVIPAIRTSQPPKRQPTYKGIRRGGAPQRAHWHPQTLSQPRPARTTNAVPNRTFQRRNQSTQMHMLQYRDRPTTTPLPVCVPRNHNVHSNATPIPPVLPISTPSGPLPRSSLPRNRQAISSGSPQPNSSSSHTSGGVQDQRQIREWELVGSGPAKKRKKKTERKCDEMRLDLPLECRKDAVQRSHFKSLFLAQLRDGLKENMDAEIVQHQFTDTQLIITYFIPDMLDSDKFGPALDSGAFAKPNIQPSIPSGSDTKLEDLYQSASSLLSVTKRTHSQTTETLGQGSSPEGNDATPIVVSTPSGSNVKLEDLYKSVSSLFNITTDISTPSSSTSWQTSSSTIVQVEEVVAAPRQILDRPRPFRSGLVTLLYGPPESLARTVSRPEKYASLPPEVIGINGTPPPYSQLEMDPRDDSQVAAVEIEARLFSPSYHAEEMPRGRVKPESSARAEPFLEEETSTIVHLPRASGDKPRRVLVSYVQDMVYSATMHGFVQEISMKSKRYIRELHAPLNEDRESVEDACLFAPPFDNIAVVAQVHEENALSLLHLGDDKKHRVTHVARTSLDRDRQRRGVSAITTLPTSSSSLSFVSAGYDHVMHFWSFDPATAFEQPPVAGIIDMHHTSVVQSLLSIGDRLISGGADNCVRTWDLHAAQTSSTIRTSNSVYQLHRTENPDFVLIEVGHCDSQFELHDCRLPADDRPPLRFGYPSVQGAHGRYARGAVDPRGWNTFVSGGRDGMMRLWDLRNPKQCKQEIMCFPGQKIVHAAFTCDNLVIASGDNQLLFFDFARI